MINTINNIFFYKEVKNNLFLISYVVSKIKWKVILIIGFLFYSPFFYSQDDRFQLPLSLQKSYFELNIGSIDYDFSKSQFETLPDYNFQSVQVPHAAVRLVLFGYKINKFFSAQISYMRPVYWVNYKFTNSNYTQNTSVWMNIAGLTVKAQLPITKKVSVFGELGLGIITRLGGESADGTEIVKKINYSSYLFGGGLKYNLNPKIDLLVSTVFSPQKSEAKQPAITFLSTGFSYKLNKLPKESILEKTEEAQSLGTIHPKHLFQLGYSSNVIGYGINNTFSEIPIFWGGEAEVNQGLTFDYRQNIYHTSKYFSLDWGVGASYYKSNLKNQSFYTIAAYPIFRFNFLHTKPLAAYLYYSIAGPSYISKKIIDNKDTGEKFTFQDTMGLGFYFGEYRNYNLEFKIGHYSNGNIFIHNAGVKIPLSVNLGYAF